ncbi:MAG: disulfide bond formation protein DsbA [Gallionellales bacterium RIFCSPLOWO2_12_FULL_59_22]|nr:MAG: disulfide bond formation protein DsbA [Gallionellales bacterium RIFCSPLOWO2_02_FULL_59_110]OGT05470.1 MAG: disulfide bond formation protein DsbA [Gallionellales bacterium RIFCSPLOWO2_02_58_13]OGT14593.1 MAG: disulfide bond formation protein DsbA [Gallionellales bacterium RIFCSPLOWO2_12_FULL_59_22]
MKQKTLFIVAFAGLLLAFIVGTLLYTAQKDNRAGQVAEAGRAALVRMHSPVLGKADALVVIVEFIDPACETCRAFYPLVKEIMAANPGKIRLVLRYAPFHTGSDRVVAVLEAARKQGKFWEALEALLAAQADWSPHHTPQVELVWKHLEGLGLNLEKVREDMAAPAIASLIAQDLADARTLNVTQTPEFFVNGKPLPSFGSEQLIRLVEDALSETARR